MQRGDRIIHTASAKTGTVIRVFRNDWLIIKWDLGTESGCWASEVEKTNGKAFSHRSN